MRLTAPVCGGENAREAEAHERIGASHAQACWGERTRAGFKPLKPGNLLGFFLLRTEARKEVTAIGERFGKPNANPRGGLALKGESQGRCGMKQARDGWGGSEAPSG
jgi:hypothetical protein